MASIDQLVDELRDAARDLDAVVSQSGLVGRFTSTYRSRAEQTRLYRAYISGRHNFPVAPPGSSAHEYGEAFDYVVDPPDYQSDVGRLWQSWGGTWAGRADVVHFELPGATARAKQRFEEESAQSDVPWYVDILSGLPFGIGSSILLSLTGVPTAARKDITPSQQEILSRIAKSIGDCSHC